LPRATPPVPVTTTLVGFDGNERCVSEVLMPADRDELRSLLASHERLAVRGSGLSYCMASGADHVPSISMRHLDRILQLDADAGTVRVEPGLTIGALLRHLVGEGFWFPVLPGHPEITVGGCVAFNTHGKTQHDVGQFADHVVALTLLHPDHGETVCTPEHNSDLFFLTVGGMGLTGWIVDVTLRIGVLAGGVLVRRAHPVTGFIEAVEIMERHDVDDVHLYSWNDGNRRGAGFGRGVVYEERFVSGAPQGRGSFRKLNAQRRGRFVPVPVWNRLTTSIVNRAYRALEIRRRPQQLPVLDGAFPINGKEAYFHAYGRRGFHEYQLIVPRDLWSGAVERVRTLIATSGACIPLASLKLFRGEPRYLWFRGDGVCLTLDTPAGERGRRLFAELDDLAVDLGAPVNLSKDSRLGADAVARIFPGYDEFKRRLDAHDPAHRVDSELRRRINV
jgi:decaprenylphospho-beta-D-ribofuranose 2-oxidase